MYCTNYEKLNFELVIIDWNSRKHGRIEGKFNIDKNYCSATKGLVIRATFSFDLHAALLRCKLKSVVVRITTHLKHCHACCSNLNWHLFFSTNFFNLQQQILFCVTMFEVGGNMANNAFQLAVATQQCCVANCSDLLLVLLHPKDL